MTASAAMKIYQVAKKTDRRDFRIEDMLFTGVFREKAQVKNITGLNTPGISLYTLYIFNCFADHTL